MEMKLLSKIKILHLTSNKLTGAIQTSIGNLLFLEKLVLLDNDKRGKVPFSLSQTRMRIFSIGENNFMGELPPSLHNLSSLNDISLRGNQFYGALRSDTGLLAPNLRMTVLSNNQFAGPIPASFSNASGLGIIDISKNNFTGTISSSFGSLQNLTWLNIWGNFLGGSSSDDGLGFLEHLVNCTMLKKLDSSDNQYEAELPLSITNLTTRLQWLQMYSNMFYGHIQEIIDQLTGLQELGL